MGGTQKDATFDNWYDPNDGTPRAVAKGSPEARKLAEAGWIKGTPPRETAEGRGKDVDQAFKQMEWWKKDTAAVEKRQTSFKDMVTGYDQNSTAGDQALIITYLKVLDPISVVREGEFRETEKTGGAAEKMKALWEQTKGSGRLTQAQRDELLSAGSGLYFNMLDKHMENRSHVEDVSTRLGLDPKNLKNVVDQKLLGRFQPFRNIPTTRDMRAPTQEPGLGTCSRGRTRTRCQGRTRRGRA